MLKRFPSAPLWIEAVMFSLAITCFFAMVVKGLNADLAIYREALLMGYSDFIPKNKKLYDAAEASAMLIKLLTLQVIFWHATANVIPDLTTRLKAIERSKEEAQ